MSLLQPNSGTARRQSYLQDAVRNAEETARQTLEGAGSDSFISGLDSGDLKLPGRKDDSVITIKVFSHKDHAWGVKTMEKEGRPFLCQVDRSRRRIFKTLEDCPT